MVSYTLNIVEGVMTVSISPMTTIKNRCHQIDYRALAETGEISDDLYYFRLCCLLENNDQMRQYGIRIRSIFQTSQTVSTENARYRSRRLPNKQRRTRSVQ